MGQTSKLFAAVAGYVGRPDAVGNVGIFYRPADGGDWQNVLPDLESYTVFVHPSHPDVVLAGTADGVWRSSDGGETFQRAQFPDRDRQIWSFLVDAGNPDRIYAGGSPVSLYRSEDRGETWSALPTPQVPARAKAAFEPRVMRLAQHPTKHQELYAAVEVNGVMRTTDGGATWTDCSDPLVTLSEQPHLASKIITDTFAEGMLDGHAIAISSAEPDKVIVAVRMGLFSSDDQGGSWQDMEMRKVSPVTYGRDIRISPQDPKTMYAALSVAAASKDGAVYRTQDLGATWQRFDNVQVHGTIMSVALHHADPDQVYIGARYDGEIFGTTDGGKSWSEMRLPGPVKDIYCLACG